MKSYERSFESSLSADKGDLVGRVFAWDHVEFAEGMQEKIPKTAEINIQKNCMALLSHKKESMLGRHKQNLSFERRDDGLWFKIKKVPTSIFEETSRLVQNKIIGGVSPSFDAVPTYQKNIRCFNKIFLKEISLVGKPAYSQSFVYEREDKGGGEFINYPPECYL